MSKSVLSSVQVTFEQRSLASSAFNYIIQYVSAVMDQCFHKTGGSPESVEEEVGLMC